MFVMQIDDHQTFSHITDENVHEGHKHWWEHHPSAEYLVANPLEISNTTGLLEASQTAYSKLPDTTRQVNGKTCQTSTDPFNTFASEITGHILGHLGSKDIASLRLVSTNSRYLPNILNRRLVPERHALILGSASYQNGSMVLVRALQAIEN